MIETFFKIKTVVTLEFFFKHVQNKPIRIMHGGALWPISDHSYLLIIRYVLVMIMRGVWTTRQNI